MLPPNLAVAAAANGVTPSNRLNSYHNTNQQKPNYVTDRTVPDLISMYIWHPKASSPCFVISRALC